MNGWRGYGFMGGGWDAFAMWILNPPARIMTIAVWTQLGWTLEGG